ncbi:MAG: YicC family protein, partial [Oscillospiraceae bacterium]|nr:YicC family protein [Oscillospiraceae bacterium]
MIRSMTGYGSAVQTYDGREITVEIRSVNNRFLDCSVKLPRAFSFAEEPVKQLVKRYITRGKVDVYVSVANKEGTEISVALNRPALEGYLTAMRTIAQEYGVRDDVSVGLLARMPDVLMTDKPKEDEEAAQAALLSCTEEALTRFNAMRETEGQALANDLLSKSAGILERVEKIEARSPETVAAYRERLRAKMEEVLQNTEIDESRILTEAAIFADKIAVDEETVRLRSHLDQLDQMLTAGGPIGRKLDFLLQ